jgi:hypothetical protein
MQARKRKARKRGRKKYSNKKRRDKKSILEDQVFNFGLAVGSQA